MVEPRDSCLKRRMLFACAAAYHPDRADLRSRVGWTSGQETIQDRVQHGPHIDSAVVGLIAQGVLVAFRGTMPPFVSGDEFESERVLANWLNNLRFVAKSRAPFPGQVHDDFSQSALRLWGEGDPVALGARIRDLLARSPIRKLYLTGHSKGGAVANLAAWLALELPADVQIRVFTIAAARAGDSVWRDAYQGERRIRCLRYESALDAVPYVPFGADTPRWVRNLLGRFSDGLDVGYCPVGNRVPERTGLGDNLAAFGRWVGAFPGFGARPDKYLPLLASAHNIEARSGYDALVCEPACSPAHAIVD